MILFVAGLAGVGLMTVGAHRGAELVFRYGAGVQAVEDKPAPRPMVAADSGGTGLVRTGGGVWQWVPERAAAWQGTLDWIEGAPARTSLVDGGDLGDVLAFDLEDETVFFTFPDSMDGIQFDLEVDLTELDGSFMIVHDVVDADNFRFASFGADHVRTGQAESGDLLVAESVSRDLHGWRPLRVVVDAGHVRAYVGTDLAAHGHFTAGPAAPVGLRINGTGRARMAFLTLTPTGTMNN